jgi:hypothetical protein
VFCTPCQAGNTSHTAAQALLQELGQAAALLLLSCRLLQTLSFYATNTSPTAPRKAEQPAAAAAAAAAVALDDSGGEIIVLKLSEAVQRLPSSARSDLANRYAPSSTIYFNIIMTL